MNNKKQDYLLKKNQRGFSLIELLISIVILILVMIPLTSNFFRSMRLNREAEKIQDYSNIAANIVEDLKAKEASELSSMDMITYADDGTPYDARILLSANEYKYEGKSGHSTLMNDYEMPEVTEINEDVNGLFFSAMYKNSATDEIISQSIGAVNLDNVAVEYFKTAAIDYAKQQFQLTDEYQNYLNRITQIQNGAKLPPIPEPVFNEADYSYCASGYIASITKKTMELQIVSVDNGGSKVGYIVHYFFSYQCNWPADKNITNSKIYQIDTKQYDTSFNNIYLFFNDLDNTLNPDTITVTNDSGIPINFYLVKQKDASPDAQFIMECSGDEVNIYTNMPDSFVNEAGDNVTLPNVNNAVIITSAPTDRIYSVKIEIYKFEDGIEQAKYLPENKLYTLDSIIN